MGSLSPHDDDDDDDDVFKYLNFSDSDYAGPLAAPLPASSLPPSPNDEFDMALLDTIDDTLLWEINDDIAPTVEGSLMAADDGGCSGSGPNVEELMAVPSPAWAPVTHLDCSCCHVLREVVHSDGQKNMKLALHGGLGVFYHAILDVYYNVDEYFPAMEQSYIDLSAQNLEWVKQFLLNYALLRVRERYVIMQDSLSAFYDALCVTMSYEEEKTSNINQSSIPEQGSCQSRPTELDRSNHPRNSKVGIATQRERTRRLHLKDLASYVHLPITEAAKELQICPTALKKVCRKYGMLRWPYRKIKSIDRTISSLQRELRSGPSEEATRVQAKIEKLMAERARICAGLPP